jgi:hypothetical protein
MQGLRQWTATTVVQPAFSLQVACCLCALSATNHNLIPSCALVVHSQEFARYARHRRLAAASNEFLAGPGSSAALTGLGLQQQRQQQWQQQWQGLPLHHQQQQQGASCRDAGGVRGGGVPGGSSRTSAGRHKAASAIGLPIRPINHPFQVCALVLCFSLACESVLPFQQCYKHLLLCWVSSLCGLQ